MVIDSRVALSAVWGSGRSRAGLALSLAALFAVGCSRPVDPRSDLRASLEGIYGSQTRANVSFVGGHDHLNVLLDGPAFRYLSDSVDRVRVLEVARLVAKNYTDFLRIDTLTVRFVRFVPGAGESYCFARSTSLALPKTAGVTEADFVFVRRHVNRGPCLLDTRVTP